MQNNYNLAQRDDDALIDDLARQGIAYVPFFPLGGFSPLQSSTLTSVAGRLGATPMQVALAWLLHRSPNILLIPGTSSVAHLRENLAAGQLTLSRPILATVGIIAFVASWNNYLLPLILLDSDENFPWPLGLMEYQGQYMTAWQLVLAFITLSILPAVAMFVLAQRYIITGLTAGAVKG